MIEVPLVITLLVKVASASPLAANDTYGGSVTNKRDLQADFRVRHDFILDLTFSVAYTGFALNIICASYIFYNTYQKWKRHGTDCLAMSCRIPFYTAISDTTIVVTNLVNITYTLVRSRPWPEPYCTAVATFCILAVNSNNFLYAVVASTTYITVAFRRAVHFGRGDWKLIAATISLGSIATFPFRDYFGGQAYWCLNKPEAKNFMWFSLCLYLALAAVTTFSYAQILRVLRSNLRRMKESKFRDGCRMEDRVTRRILVHLLVFLLQWVPVTAYIVYFLAEIEGTWPTITMITGISFSRILNALSYAYPDGAAGPSRDGMSQEGRPTKRSNKSSANSLVI